MPLSIRTAEERVVLRRATDRLLAWGFPPRSIAQQLGCSPSWVYAVRRERLASGDDAEQPLHTDALLRDDGH